MGNSDGATNGEEGELHNTSIVSSPNAAETNDTSNNTTDMPTVTDKDNATFANAWGVIERNCEAATTVVNNLFMVLSCGQERQVGCSHGRL